ncbi:MAG: hypothetical protein ACJ75F_02975 [Flavisolibacter sp.]|jgi:hypothetical protein
MKTILYLLAATILMSATLKTDDNVIDGVWLGSYRSGSIFEKFTVKFNSDRMEFFTGEITDETAEGSYHLYSDSVSFIYHTPNQQDILMLGRFNRKRTYICGVWKINGNELGNFYLEKQPLQELSVEP